LLLQRLQALFVDCCSQVGGTVLCVLVALLLFLFAQFPALVLLNKLMHFAKVNALIGSGSAYIGQKEMFILDLLKQCRSG
jgi:hypothetical protein